jgi:TPP-dependent indolepyruvate ferredoxin oxidoreductase alpha subunit
VTKSDRAPWGWVGGGASTGPDRKRRPAVVHADRACIENGHNPRTGERAKARPATRIEREKARMCMRCADAS